MEKRIFQELPNRLRHLNHVHFHDYPRWTTIPKPRSIMLAPDIMSSSKSSLGETQKNAQMSALQREDPHITGIILSCSHAAMYVLETDKTIHWRKLGIEGFFYLVRRNGFPRYKLILRNQTDSIEGDFKQAIDADIRVEVKGETVFYQVGYDGDVRGLWFHDRDFIRMFVNSLATIAKEIGVNCEKSSESVDHSAASPDTTSGHAILRLIKKVEAAQPPSTGGLKPIRNEAPRDFAPPAQAGQDGNMIDLLRRELESPPVIRPKSPAPGPRTNAEGSISVTRERLRDVLRDVLMSDDFLDTIIEKLKGTI